MSHVSPEFTTATLNDVDPEAVLSAPIEERCPGRYSFWADWQAPTAQIGLEFPGFSLTADRTTYFDREAADSDRQRARYDAVVSLAGVGFRAQINDGVFAFVG